MKKYFKGGIETIIAAVVLVGIIVAILITTVKPMSEQGDALLDATTNSLVQQNKLIGPESN